MSVPTNEILERLDWSHIRTAFAAHCQTHVGRQLVELGAWWHCVESIQNRYALVKEFIAFKSQEHPIPVGAVIISPVAMEKINDQTVLEIEELRDVRDMLLGLRLLKDILLPISQSAPHVSKNLKQWAFPELLCQSLEYTFTQDGQLSEQQYPKLALYKSRIREKKKHLEAELQRLLTDASVSKMLQESFVTQRNGRYVLPLKENFKRKFGIVHGRSQSGETFFVEPLSILPIANSITENELAFEQTVRQICLDLSRRIFESAANISKTLDAVALLDTAMAAARLGLQWGGVIPEVLNKGRIHLQDCRHPVLLLQGNDVVANDFTLSSEVPAILLSGPNAGGKTIALKQLGLMALLVKSGLPIPAAVGARCDYFEKLMVDIGDTQEVEAGLSTFSAKLHALKNILESADTGSLVLLDELGIGTDPAQGSALAQAVIEAIMKVDARIVVTTHFTRLKALADIDPRFQNAAAQFHDGRPTYALQWGMMGQSYAFDVATRMGFPESVLDRAASLLSNEEQNVAELSAELEHRLLKVNEQEVQLTAERENILVVQSQLKTQEAKLSARHRAIQGTVIREFQDTLWQTYLDLKSNIAELKKSGDIDGLKQASRQLTDFQDQVQSVTSKEQKKMFLHDDSIPQNLSVGQQVYVPNMDSEGEVLKINRNSVLVLVNRMRMKLKKSEVRTRTTTKLKKSVPQSETQFIKDSNTPSVSLTTPRSVDNTCDLRGLRVEEAIVEMELFFAKQIGVGAQIAYLLHGHGTGRLKAGLRSYLPTCSLVVSWQPAQYSQGGDAFTRVELS